ncbi:MAG: FmdB family transcriptional regulator [Acidimicrobiales bacterium]|nr:MAG: FmdB family transcriptional regulator [Acidimicrobiales bacterium]
MPTYVYKFVDTGETIEVQQGFHDENLTEIAHPDSGEVLPVKKVFTPVGVTFKGSGFFKTDNRGKKSASSPAATSSDSSSSDSSSKSESKYESKSESKSASKSESKSESKPANTSDSSSSSST